MGIGFRNYIYKYNMVRLIALLNQYVQIKGGSMKSVIFINENSSFKFILLDVIELLKFHHTESDVPEADSILKYLSKNNEDPVIIPGNYNYFGFIALDLIESGKGSVTCKMCNKTYPAGQLKPITVGHGKSPFDVKFSRKWRVKNLFRRPKLPGMFGGKGYECPQGHELIAMITWRT